MIVRITHSRHSIITVHFLIHDRRSVGMMAALRRHDDLRHGCNLAVESSWRETGSGDQQLFRNHKAPIGTNGRADASAIERSKRTNITNGCCLDLSCAGLSRPSIRKTFDLQCQAGNARAAYREAPVRKSRCKLDVARPHR
jgi:hypothetical protein